MIFLLLILFVLSVVDLREMIVPGAGIAAVAGIGVLRGILGEQGWMFHVKGGLILFCVCIGIALISGGLGGGDVKLFGALGFALGTRAAAEIFVLAFLLSGIFVSAAHLLLRITGREGRFVGKKEIPFVPFIGAAAAVLFLLPS